MKTFDFKQARKQVTKIEGDFKKVHDLLDGFGLSILDRGVIDTILHKYQSEMTTKILTGQIQEDPIYDPFNVEMMPARSLHTEDVDINHQTHSIDIESSLQNGAAIATDYAKDATPVFIQQNSGDWITTDDTSSK